MIRLLISLLLLSFLSVKTYSQVNLDQAKKLYADEQFEAAFEAYKEKLKEDPSNYATVLGMADSKHKLGQLEQAVEMYDRAEKLNANDAELYYNRGIAYVFLEEFGKAIKDFNQSEKLRPDHAQLFYYRGYAQAALSRYRNAIEDYSRALELKPDYAEAYYNRGAAKAELDNFEAGMQDFQTALEKKPDLENGKINIALSKLGMKQYQAAIDGLTEIIEERADNLARAYFYRGEAYYELKQKDQACSDWRKAANLKHEQAIENTNNFCDSETGKKKRDIDIVF
jgi:serine/threonine-protein kinase